MTFAIVTFEVVYRLVALPLDYVPPGATATHHEAVLTEAIALEATLPEAPAAAASRGLALAGRIEAPWKRTAIAVGPTPALGPVDPPVAPELDVARLDDTGLGIAGLDAAGPDAETLIAEVKPDTPEPYTPGSHSAEPPAPEPPAAEPPAARPLAFEESLDELPVDVAASRREAASVLASLPSLPVPRRPGERPLISVVIDDMGYSPRSLQQLAAMPGPLTLAFLPNAEGTPAMLEHARRQPFELMLHLPMEPLGDADPGPGALLADLDDEELRRRVRHALGAVPGVVGVNNHMGSRLTADPQALAIVMEELRQYPLFFLDSLTNPASLAETAAAAAGIPTGRRDVFIDHLPEPAAIARQLRQIEQVARQRGSSIAIGHPYPETLQALERWLPTLEDRGFRLARATEVIALRRCGDPTLRPSDCRPGFHLVSAKPQPLRPQGDAASP